MLSEFQRNDVERPKGGTSKKLGSSYQNSSHNSSHIGKKTIVQNNLLHPNIYKNRTSLAIPMYFSPLAKPRMSYCMDNPLSKNTKAGSVYLPATPKNIKSLGKENKSTFKSRYSNFLQPFKGSIFSKMGVTRTKNSIDDGESDRASCISEGSGSNFEDSSFNNEEDQEKLEIIKEKEKNKGSQILATLGIFRPVSPLPCSIELLPSCPQTPAPNFDISSLNFNVSLSSLPPRTSTIWSSGTSGTAKSISYPKRISSSTSIFTACFRYHRWWKTTK